MLGGSPKGFGGERKAPERSVGQARDYPLGDSIRAAVPPPPASQAPPLRGGWCASLRSAPAACRRQPQNGLSGCAASTFAAGRRTIRSLEGCCKRGVVLLLLLVRRLSAYGVGALPQALQGLCPVSNEIPHLIPASQALFEEKGLNLKPFFVFVSLQISIC